MIRLTARDRKELNWHKLWYMIGWFDPDMKRPPESYSGRPSAALDMYERGRMDQLTVEKESIQENDRETT